ncbi:MAG: SUMF1/EgtB/PvdO family nonheme iron enzyme [Anaerolineae bacterium]
MKLFISYSRDDKAWVYNLRDALRTESDHEVWIDRGLVPGQDWWQTILESIEAHECFVYVVTPKSVESIYCQAELGYALALNKPILPLMLKQADYPSTLQHIQFQFITDEMNIDRVLLKVERGLSSIQRDIDRGKYVEPTPRRPRPGPPTPAREPEQVAEVFALAAEAVAANNIPLAEKLFKQVMDADPQGWGLAAADRLAEIRLERARGNDYLVILRMAGNPATVKDARAGANAYVRKYGRDYDPRGILPALLASPSRSAIPEPMPVATPAGWNTAKLRDVLNSRLSLDELRNAALDLKVDYEGLEKGELTRRIILNLEQRGHLDQLIVWLQANRPDLDAGQFGAASAVPARESPAATRIEVVAPPPAPKPAGPALGDRMTDPHGVTMVYVPPGKFLMGAADITNDEKPPHEIVIAQGFWLDLTPVTNAMYADFVKSSGYKKQEFWTKGGWEWVQANKKQGPEDYNGFTDGEQPRVGVTWFEAYAYCRWCGGRLPTEAEWEWAARGPENRKYPWGNEFDGTRVVMELFWKNYLPSRMSDVNSLASGKTAAVNASTRVEGASWVGVLDMSGHVWEWTGSLYRLYPYNDMDGRESLDDVGNPCVLRGGSWDSKISSDLQATSRYKKLPFVVANNIGFRCARHTEPVLVGTSLKLF